MEHLLTGIPLFVSHTKEKF